MKKKVYIILSIVLLIIGFIYLMIKLGKQSAMYEYQKDLITVPDFLKNHYPINSDLYSFANLNISYPFIDENREAVVYRLTCSKVSEENINKELAKIEMNKIASYKSSDSHLLLINKMDTILDNDSVYYPIPYFNLNDKKYPSNNKSGLDDNFNIYILECQISENFKNNRKELLPKDWPRNGYSKGVCINEKERIIIYWFVVW